MESDPSQDGGQVGWLTRSAPTNYSFPRTNQTTGHNICQLTARNSFSHIHNNHEHTFSTSHRVDGVSFWQQTNTLRHGTARFKCHQEKLIWQRNKSPSQLPMVKGLYHSVSASVWHKCLSFLTWLWWGQAGVASDIILTTSGTGPKQQMYSNVNVKRDPMTQISVVKQI